MYPIGRAFRQLGMPSWPVKHSPFQPARVQPETIMFPNKNLIYNAKPLFLSNFIQKLHLAFENQTEQMFL